METITPGHGKGFCLSGFLWGYPYVECYGLDMGRVEVSSRAVEVCSTAPALGEAGPRTPRPRLQRGGAGPCFFWGWTRTQGFGLESFDFRSPRLRCGVGLVCSCLCSGLGLASQTTGFLMCCLVRTDPRNTAQRKAIKGG